MPSCSASRRYGKPIRRSADARAMRSGSPKSTAISRYTSKNAGRSCSVPMWLSRCADVEAPVDGLLDLGPALLAHLVEVGVVPDVVDGAREAAVAVEEAGGVGDRAPAVVAPTPR